METVAIIIMILVSLGFVIKLTFLGMTGRFIVAVLAAAFTMASVDLAASQSKTQMSEWLSQTDLMLDVAVLITIDVSVQLMFCVLAVGSMYGRLALCNNCLYNILRYVPGLLIFPVLFVYLSELMFEASGISFSSVGWGMAAMVILLVLMFPSFLNKAIPEYEIRLELLFMLNLLIVALGIIATVNGRASADGTNTVSWYALLAVIVLTAMAVPVGLIISKHHISKQISKL